MKSETGRKIHVYLMGFWAVNMVVIVYLYGGTDPRILYLMIVSIYANFVGHWSGWSAERHSEIEETKS